MFGFRFPGVGPARHLVRRPGGQGAFVKDESLVGAVAGEGVSHLDGRVAALDELDQCAVAVGLEGHGYSQVDGCAFVR